MWTFLQNLAHALNPKVSDTPEQLFAWRQTVAFSIVLLSVISLLSASQANGWLERFGVSGYVTLAQLAPLEQLARASREDQLVQQILDLTRRYCLSYEVNDQSGMSFAFQALQEARAKYFSLTKREYPQLMCSVGAQPARPNP